MPSFPHPFATPFGFDPTATDLGGGLALFDAHPSRGVSRLLEQFKGKPRIESFTLALMKQAQALEYASWQLLSERSIESAAGVWLDALADVLGIARDGSTDEELRGRVLVEIAVLGSSCTGPELAAIATAFASGVPARVETWRPCEAAVVLDGPVTYTLAFALSKTLRRASAAASRVLLEWLPVAPSSALTLAPWPAVDSSSTTTGLGWTTDAATGGALAGAIEP